MSLVDCYVSQPGYVGHLLPVWQALPDAIRGTWWCPARLADSARQAGVQPRIGRPPAKHPRLVLVAGYGDLQSTRGHRHVFIEHGAGQTYGGAASEDPSYSGGRGRGSVELFLVPNEHCALRNTHRYPDARVEVVGSPWVDSLCSVAHYEKARSREGDGVPNPTPITVALSFHWRCAIAPEAGWALPHYEAALPSLVSELRSLKIDTIGHGHPRYRRYFAGLWERLGIEHVPDFADVVRRADQLVADNTSALYEAAACGIPVVLLDAPWFNCGRGHWPRFDGSAASNVGEHVQEPADVVPAIQRALGGWTDIARAKAVAEVYPMLDGKAAERSAIAIAEVLSDLP